MTTSDQTIHESGVEELLRTIQSKEKLTGNQVDEVRDLITNKDQFTISPAHSQEPLPRQLGRFRLLKLLGKGGCAYVYLSEDAESGKQVALKLPRPEKLIRPEWRERFLREARAASVLEHDNIIHIFDTGEIEGQWYISSRYCPGPNLAQWLAASNTSVSFVEAAQFFHALAGALAHAHERGVIHRDLKPSNILLQPRADLASSSLADFTPCIADFGLAKLIEESGEQTLSGVLLGTIQYMAPEQAAMKRKEIRPATDLYAFGLILYEVLTRHTVVPAEPVILSVQRIIHDPAPRLRLLRPDCPADLETIYLKCLEKSPDSRYSSAAALQYDLERFLKGQSIIARPASMVHRVRNWIKREPLLATFVLFTLFIMTLVLAGLLIYARQTLQSNERYRTALKHSQQLNYLSSMQRAAQLVQSGDASKASLVLTRCRDELEDEQIPLTWEWRYLWNRVQRMPRHYRWFGHHETPYSLTYSGVNNWVATADGLGTVIVRNATTGNEVKSFQAHNKENTPLCFSPDGNWLAQYDGDSKNVKQTIYLWDTRTWTLRNSLAVTGEVFTDFCFHPQGDKLMVSTAIGNFEADQGRLLTWNFKEANAPAREVLTGCNTQKLTWCAARKSWILVGSTQFLMVDEQFHTKRILSGTGTFVKGAACSPDGNWFAWGSREGNIYLYDMRVMPPKEVRSWKAHPEWVTQLNFSPDSKMLAGSGFGRVVQLWDVPSAKLLYQKEAKGVTYGVTFAEDGKSLFFGSTEDFAVHRWFYADESRQSVHADLKDQVWSAILTPEGNQLLVGLDDIHAPETFRQLEVHRPGLPTTATTALHSATLTGIVLWDKGERMITSSLDGELILQERKSGKTLFQTTAHETRGIRKLIAVEPDKSVATCGLDGLICLWDRQLQPIGTPINGHGGIAVSYLAYHPSARLLFSAGNDGRVCAWDLATHELVRSWDAEAQAWSLALSHNGKHLAFGNKLGLVYLIALETGEVIQQFRGHDHGVTSIAFTPDDRSLITGDNDGHLLMWNVESGQQLLNLPPHQKRVSALVWNKDGTRLYSTGLDGRVVEHDFR